MNERDAAGRFVLGNACSSSGGRARAEKLDADRRRAIARKGWEGLVLRRFDGDRERAARWLGALGAWAADASYRDRFPVFEHPGPCPGAE